jgi:hypothetical protein
MQDTVLKKLNADGTTTTLVADIDPNDNMCYVAVNDIVFFSNKSMIGYVYRGLSYPFPTPTDTYKKRMVGGHILEWYNSRLYAANDRTIYYSDSGNRLMQMDFRKNAKAFPYRITMMKSVQDGIYVSYKNRTLFLSGTDPESFYEKHILDVGAIEGMSVTAYGENIGNGISGKALYFVGEDGIPYKGYPDGVIREMQDGRFAISGDIEIGASIIRYYDKYRHFLAVGILKAGIGGVTGEAIIPPVTI